MTFQHWQSSLTPAQHEEAEERAAIIEEGCQVSREEAELSAMRLLRERWEGQQ